MRGEEITLGGARARLELSVPLDADASGPFELSVWAPHVPSQVTRENLYYARGFVSVSVRTTCATRSACDELELILRTFEAR